MDIRLAWPARPWPSWPAFLAVEWASRLAEERSRLAPWLAVALGIGVLAYFALPAEPPAAIVWVAPPLLLLAVWLGLRRPLAGWALGMLALAIGGFAVAAWHTGRQPPAMEPPRSATIVTGRVLAVELLPNGRRITLGAPRLDGGEAEARHVRLRLRRQDPATPAPGDTVQVRAMLHPPAPPAYPGAWDFQRMSWFSGLGASGYALGPAEVTPGLQPPPAFAALRARIEARVAIALPGPTGAVAGALLTGGKSAIPEGELAAVRDSGLAHLRSVSGLHIGIVMGLSFWVVRWLVAALPWLALRLPGKAVAACAALAAGGFYMLISGSQVPMQRSFAMAALATLALLAGRRALTLRGLAMAAAVVLVAQPSAVLGASFQMSFAAVLALIAGWEWLRPRVPAAGPRSNWRRRLILGGFGVVATSVLAGIATTPFGLYNFGRLQLYGVLANAIAVPITSMLVMPAGMLATLLMPFGLEGVALVPMGWGVDAILAVARLVAGLPGSAIQAQPIPAWGLGACSLGLLWLCLWRTGWRLAGVPLFVLGLGSASFDRPPDLLISGDARLVGLRAGETLFVHEASGGSAFTRGSWQRLHGATGSMVMPKQGEAAGGLLRCGAGACFLRPRPDAPVAALLLGGAPADACRNAALVVSAEPVRGRCTAQVVDRFAVWRNGAHAVWLEPAGVRVVSDRGWRGNRPWVPPVPRPRAVPSSEPPARAE
jgi:competence protein ComEC